MSTPVEEIRRAAQLMRANAQVARPVPDEVWLTYFSSTEGRHFASWHPGVALAVADWLDYEAASLESLGGLDRVLLSLHPHILAVARAYLGDAS